MTKVFDTVVKDAIKKFKEKLKYLQENGYALNLGSAAAVYESGRFEWRNGGCHGFVKYFDNKAVAYLVPICVRKGTPNASKFIHWLLNDSPWSACFISKKPEAQCSLGTGYGRAYFVLVDTKLPSNYVQSALIMSRTCWDQSKKTPRLEMLKAFKNKNLHPLLCYFIGSFRNKSGELMSRPYALGAHSPFAIVPYSLKRQNKRDRGYWDETARMFAKDFDHTKDLKFRAATSYEDTSYPFQSVFRTFSSFVTFATRVDIAQLFFEEGRHYTCKRYAWNFVKSVSRKQWVNIYNDIAERVGVEKING